MPGGCFPCGMARKGEFCWISLPAIETCRRLIVGPRVAAVNLFLMCVNDLLLQHCSVSWRKLKSLVEP